MDTGTFFVCWLGRAQVDGEETARRSRRHLGAWDLFLSWANLRSLGRGENVMSKGCDVP